MKTPEQIQKLITEQITKNNREFLRLPKAKQRVMIAQDVLAQLKLKRIRPEARVYIETGQDTEVNQEQLFFGPKIENCRVCATGAAMLSSMRLCNVGRIRSGSGDSEEIKGQLLKSFPREQIALIEAAFERDDECPMNRGQLLTEAQWEAAKKFYDDRGGSEDKVLKAIFKNIIRNNGTFKP